MKTGGMAGGSEVEVTDQSIEKGEKYHTEGIGKSASCFLPDDKQVGKWDCYAGYQLSACSCHVF